MNAPAPCGVAAPGSPGARPASPGFRGSRRRPPLRCSPAGSTGRRSVPGPRPARAVGDTASGSAPGTGPASPHQQHRDLYAVQCGAQLVGSEMTHAAGGHEGPLPKCSTAPPHQRCDSPVLSRSVFGSRPALGGPAYACAIVVHCSASASVTCGAVSSRCRRRVATRQNSSAVPATRSPASSGPHAHTPPSGAPSSTRTGATGASQPFTVKLTDGPRRPGARRGAVGATGRAVQQGRRRRPDRAPTSPQSGRPAPTSRSSAARTTASADPGRARRTPRSVGAGPCRTEPGPRYRSGRGSWRRRRRGRFVHTEEVTGSIPVSPTANEGR